jgi:exodeoxyribonuclease V alpha subunit
MSRSSDQALSANLALDASALSEAVLDLFHHRLERMEGEWIARLLDAAQQGHTALPAEDQQAETRPDVSEVDAPNPTPSSESTLVCRAGEYWQLRRYFLLEQVIARQLLKRAHVATRDGLPSLPTWLTALLPQSMSADAPQLRAIVKALDAGISIIHGGPGTGKTTTVFWLLAAMLHEQPELRVALAAPTGKAANRMLDALRTKLSALPASVQARFPRKAFTVHRLLGFNPAQLKVRHSESQPLALDLLVLDEASMLDVELFEKLLSALPANARLVILGDPEQLSAVSAGSVLPHLVQALENSAATTSKLADLSTRLSIAHRFAGSSLNDFAQAMRSTEPGLFVEQLKRGEWPDVQLIEPQAIRMQRLMRERVLWLKQLRDAGSPEQAWSLLIRKQLLTALRHGPDGIEQLNRWADRQLAEGEPLASYHGRPVLLRHNLPDLGLYNGDQGIFWRTPGTEAAVHFVLGEKSIRIARDELPTLDGAFSLTVHQAQGSEFDEVTLWLPPAGAPILSRQWLYTAATRAKSKLLICADQTVLIQALERHEQRYSALGWHLERQS